MRLRPTTVRKLLSEVDRPVKAERAVLIDINVQRLEVGWSVDDANVAGLHEVIGDDDVLLVGSDLDVVRSDSRLVFIGVVEALDVVQVGDVEGGDVVGGGEGDCEDLLVARTIERVVADLQYAYLPSLVMSE